MADFTPINSQEELDKVIASRIQRERETVTKQFQAQLTERDQKISGFEKQVNDLNKQIETFSGQAGTVTELEAKIKGYETSSVKMRIAHEVGLPYEMADRLSGDDEKAIRTDAELLKKLMGVRITAPLRDSESGTAPASEKDRALMKLLKDMKGES